MVGAFPEVGIEPVLGWLERRGYRVLRRHEVWHECWISRAGESTGSIAESWVGRGTSEREAVLAALGLVFPSAAARAALEEALRVEASGSARSAVEPGVGERERARAVPETPAASERPTAAAKTAESKAARAAPAPAPETSPAPEASGAPPPSGSAAPPAVKRLPALPRGEAVAALEELRAELEAQHDEVALWAPERQRLKILVWIAWARALGETSLDRAVKDLVHEIARELGSSAGRWWPGSVRALQISSFPAESAREFRLTGTPGSWLEVAELAETTLQAGEEREESEGADEDGWFDGDELQPGHPDPRSALREVKHALEEESGALDAKPERLVHPRKLDSAALLRLAKTLRWIRRAVADAEGWGDALGRLRWIAREGETSELARWVAPRFRPRKSWAAELGWDPEKRVRSERRRAVLRAAPAPGSEPSEAALRAWLVDAFECGPELDNGRIAELLRPFAARVAALDPVGFAERAHRRRITKVQDLLAAGGATEPAPAPASEEEPEPDVPGLGAALEPEGNEPAEVMLAELLPFTRGKRALLVSNRTDEHQDETLKETFAFEELDHAVATPRRLDAVRARIEGGGYHVVLSATGFQSHSSDRVLKLAADAAGIPYVRCNRARRLACIRALHRDLPRAAARAEKRPVKS